jgi:EAL domain-containing protein (putative c-di-GMP-specific phosphodiesterase class I)/GGDEF domain-containing protein
MKMLQWLALAVRKVQAAAPATRDVFQESAERVLAAGEALTLAYLNVERFRCIVRLCGPAHADDLLEALGRRFAAAFGSAAVLRLPGDEFLLQFRGEAGDIDVELAMAELACLVAQPFSWAGGSLTLSAAIGSASAPRDGSCFQQLFDRAEQAMLGARAPAADSTAAGQGDAVPATTASADDCMRDALQTALERKEFVLYYQPQVDLLTNEVIGAEALIRWVHPERGLLAPGQFIEAAERTGMIVPIGNWVLQEACLQAARWRAAGHGMEIMAVNLSACQFESGKLGDIVQAALAAAGLPPSCLELELTENILIRDTDNVLRQIRQLKNMGLTLSLDDFGTGYSSLSYLKKFAVDKIKIDRSFVGGLGKDPSDATIVRAIVEIARSLGLRTIAEGVEDARTLEYLQLLSCDEVQGYYFAPPLTVPAFERMLAVLRRYPGWSGHDRHPPIYCSRINDPLKSGHQPLNLAAQHCNGSGRWDSDGRLMG